MLWSNGRIRSKHQKGRRKYPRSSLWSTLALKLPFLLWSWIRWRIRLCCVEGCKGCSFLHQCLESYANCTYVRDGKWRTIHAVNGTCIIRRWTGSEVMHQSSIEVPAIVGAYNLFMNTANRMDQFDLPGLQGIVRKGYLWCYSLLYLTWQL